MGQSMKKLASGVGRKEKEIETIVETVYSQHFSAAATSSDDTKPADFYRAVSHAVQEMNKKLGNTQFRVPEKLTLELAYNKHHQNRNGAPLTREEFQKMLQDVIVDTGFTGAGAKDILFYVFGVPMATLLVKQRVAPKAIPNEIFIPCVTSATVFVLAQLNKI